VPDDAQNLEDHMSNLIVVTFPNIDDAEKALEALKSLSGEGMGKIEDSAVVVKDADGKVKVHGQASSGAVSGGVVGGLLGLLIAGIFPIAGIALGAAAGALIGRSFGDHVDKKFVQDVEKAMAPNSSALFILGKGNPDAIAAAFRPFEGTLYHTNVDPEKEQQLRDALK
jgi:uncharacterized membrane protein